METNHALDALSALGQETRLEVFRLLVRAGGDGLAAGEIGGHLNVPPNTLSSHLAILHRAGLVSSRREGRVVRYFADMEGMRALLDFLLQDCCGGQPDLCRTVLTRVARDRA